MEEMNATKLEENAYEVFHARHALKRLADTNNSKTDCDMQLKDMTLKELSYNKYLKVKGIIDGVYITPLAREVKPHKSRDGE